MDRSLPWWERVILDMTKSPRFILLTIPYSTSRYSLHGTQPSPMFLISFVRIGLVWTSAPSLVIGYTSTTCMVILTYQVIYWVRNHLLWFQRSGVASTTVSDTGTSFLVPYSQNPPRQSYPVEREIEPKATTQFRRQWDAERKLKVGKDMKDTEDDDYNETILVLTNWMWKQLNEVCDATCWPLQTVPSIITC